MNRLLRHALAAGLALCVWLGLVAAALAATPHALRFEHLDMEQGLPQESVLAMVQDRQGFMWFGTQAGLGRYDGYRITTFKSAPSDPSSLVDNWVQVLYLDDAGRLWIGTDGGLDRYDPAAQRFVHFRPPETAQRGNGNRHIRAIIGDGAHGMWIASADGLQHFDPASGAFRVWHHAEDQPGSLADDRLTALARDGAGRLWIGTETGVDMLAPGAAAFVHFRIDDGSRWNEVRALLVDPQQALWVGTSGGVERWQAPAGGVAIGARSLRKRLSYDEGLPTIAVTSLYQDADKNLWMGTYAGGAYRWRPEQQRFEGFHHLGDDAHSIADDRIASLYQDRVGTFWIGTWYEGVSRTDLTGGGFSRYVRLADQPDSLSDNRVRALADGDGGVLWVGTNDGLNRLDTHNGSSTAHRRMLQDPVSGDPVPEEVTALWRGPDRQIWVGGRGGLARFDPATSVFTSVPLRRVVPGDEEVRGIAGDRAGAVWIAMRGGLRRLALDGTQTIYQHDPADSSSLADNVVRPMLEDRKGRFWVGTFNGLDLLDRGTGRFRHFRHDDKDPESLSHDEVHYLYEDMAGTLWVGTANGLNRMVERDGRIRFLRYTRGDGLADDAVSAILGDAKGMLWISTNSGISRLDPRTDQFRNYGGVDGTIEGAYFDGAALETADGTMYFGGFNGITTFAPAAIHDNPLAPGVAITELQIFNKPVRAGEGDFGKVLATAIDHTAALTLPADAAVFSLEFAALHFAAPERNLFAYQLRGFDRDWVQTDSSKRFATYTNLDPGHYTFRVKAANKDGVWNDTGATLEITILPPLWKTWWFRLLVALLLIGAAWAAYRSRMRGLRRQQAWLETEVGLRTVEVEQKNRQLQSQTGELEQRRMEAERQRMDAVQRRVDAERQKLEVERQKEAVELAHRNISVLSEIGREMTATLDMETAMMTVYRHVHELMDAGIFGIGFYREEQHLIEFPFSMEHGVRSQFYTRQMDDPHQFSVWCVANEREVFINDVEREYRDYIGEAGLSTVAHVRLITGAPGATPRSMMYVPLVLKDRVVGVLGVQSEERNAYRRVHLDMLQTLAAHAAVGLDNARAYQRLEEAAQALRQTETRLLHQEKQVRLHTDELARANRTLQENDERLRLAKEKAEDATRQKSEFLANMSHEMRTPLAGVIGMLGFALRDLRLQERTRAQILRGQANAQSLLAIINDLLDFSKIEAGKLSIENIDFALVPAIENVASLFEEQAAARSVGFSIAFGPGLPTFVVGDPTRLRQVLVNLVGNAFKFTRSGEVKVVVDRVEPHDDGNDLGAGVGGVNLIRFTVQDSGIGISPEAMPRLFQKFEQADATTTRRYGGTGLGLAICRQLVDLMDGEIGVDSTPGVGSTFRVLLPLPDGVAPPMQRPVEQAPHTHQLRVLCAEDFPTNQIIIRMMLEDLGHQVDIAANGLLAVQACARTRYDLILMDGRMPEMDGASATRLIRAGGPSDAPVLDQELMIVALTANASEEDRSRYLGAGMDDFLTKPIDEAMLHMQLARAIERQLQRGFLLPKMPDGGAEPPPAAAPPTTLELDAMFGVTSGALVAPAEHPGRRAGDLKRRIRSAFSADVAGRLEELEKAMDQRDGDVAGRLLHGLKGSAAYLDEIELHLLSSELEAAADRADWSLLLQCMPRLRQLLELAAATHPA